MTLRAIPGVPRIAQLSRRLLLTADGDGAMLDEPAALAPRTQTTTSISSRRTAAFTSTPLDEIKAIKNHFGVTVNDVVMAIIAGALRAWLSERDELPAAPLAAMVPISVRAPEQSGAFGNRMAMMIPPLHTEEPDPERRLRLTHESMRSAKERHEAVPATLAPGRQPLHPAGAARPRRARLRDRRVESAARGGGQRADLEHPRARACPQYMAGARLLAHYPCQRSSMGSDSTSRSSAMATRSTGASRATRSRSATRGG